jgi:uncharacterized protein Yka (UPF0111/DUF47 family)
MHIRDVILPEDRVFFELFDRMTGTIEEAAQLLTELTADLSRGSSICHQIRLLEHEGDGITRQVYERLNQSLITPLEPEEISRLAPALDDILDRIDRVAQQLCTYGLTETNEVLVGFGKLIAECSEEIRASAADLRMVTEAQNLQARAIAINHIWNRTSELRAQAVLDLFSTGDPVHIIKLKDIYENLEAVMEKCNDYGHVLNDIGIGHS